MDMMNIMIVGIVSTILSIIAFIINAKVRSEEIDTTSMLKMGGLGFVLGVSNIMALQYLGSDSLTSSTPEFLTGNPDF
tara:strand:- start:3671 stop:3904 length:234 start_codon:yes stop_codon:yes gene_type:complete